MIFRSGNVKQALLMPRHLPSPPHFLVRSLMLATCVAVGTLTAEAQPGGGQGSGGFGGRGMRGGGRFGFEPGSILPELRRPEFLEEIKFTDEQQKELETVRSEFDFRQMFRLPEEERKQKFKDYEAKVIELLTADQKKFWEKRKAELIAKAKEANPPAEATSPIGTPPANPNAPSAVPKRRVRPEAPVPEGATATVSFEAAGESESESTDGAGTLKFNFQYAAWADVLELFAQKADLTLDLDDTPPGTFTYRDSKSYTPTQALDVLNGYLLPRGFLLVKRDRFLVCLNISEGIPPNLAPQISPEELAQRGKNELVSVVIPVRGMQADQIVGEVKELLGPQGSAAALKNTNSLVVTDIASHVRRIYALISAENAVDTRDTAFKAIPLKHISASEAERMVRRLFGLNTMTTSGAAAPQGQWPQQPGQNGGGWGGWGRRRDRDRGDGDNSDQQPQNPQPPQGQPIPPAQPVANTASQFANKIHVAADVRTNHLLVTASASLLMVVEDAVKTLDTDEDASGNKLRRVDVPLTFKIYTVPGGDVASIAQTVNQLVPGVVVGQDARLGKLHVQATPDEHAEVGKLIEELGGEGSSSVAVIHLHRMDPVQLSNTLINLYSKEGVRAPTVEADPLGRRLIVRGSPDQILQVKTILTQLGEGDGAPRDKANRGNVRSINLGGRDPDEILPLLQDAWSATRPNPIRIKVPSAPRPIRERAVPGADRRPQRDENPVGNKPAPRPNFIRRTALQHEKSDVEQDDNAEESAPADEPQTPAESSDAKSETAPAGNAPVSVQIIGDQLILSSSDTAALDRLEELYERMSSAIPSRTRWNVFYLRTADATEAAQMVERLFPQSNVAAATTTSSSSGGMLGSLAGGMSSIGRSLMNASGLNQTLSGAQTLRIVTDARANALYVSGPNDQVAEVEQILEVLDSSELPPSLRDRLPRTIAVEHADVEEVADVIETVFKDQMTPENPMLGRGGSGGPGGFNPLMMMFGGAAQAQGGRRQPGVQLTVGVDKRTNHLIVSCSDSLFQQIEEVVRGIDDRAKKSRQTVRVVKLDTADPTLVQQTLGSIMPKVTVGTTRRSRSSTRTSSSSTSDRDRESSIRSSGSSDDARREFFQRMMMERMSSGGGDFGRRSFGGDSGRNFGGDRGRDFGGGRRRGDN